VNEQQRESHRLASRKWARENKEKTRQNLREWRAKNPELDKQKTKRWKDKNKNQLSEYYKCYYNSHREEMLIRAKNYYSEHKEERSEYDRKWRKNKPKKERKPAISKTMEYKKAARHSYKQRFRDAGKLTTQVVMDIYDKNIERFGELTCYLCLSPVQKGLEHLEHNVPLSRGGKNERSNLEISCVHCNCVKGNKTAEEFLNANPARCH
jgi:5-methylcytosine-specific restriction endonuclease McrA